MSTKHYFLPNEQSGLQIRTAHPIKTTQTANSFSAGLSMDILVPLSTLDLKKVKAALACRSSILEQIDRGELPSDKPEQKYPYPEGTKFANKINVKQTILSEADKAAVENMYLSGMSMSAIARIYNCHYTTIGRILRKRNVPIR